MTTKRQRRPQSPPQRKSAAKKSNGSNGEGYKGHRPGSIKEKIHLLYDKHGPEKARPLALKAGAALGTVNTSASSRRQPDRAPRPDCFRLYCSDVDPPIVHFLKSTHRHNQNARQLGNSSRENGGQS